MINIKKNIFSRKNLAAATIALIYAAFTFVLVLHHECWADEVNVWLILKNLSLSQAFMHISAEGHPFLFYLLCLPFVKMGCSFFAVQMICHIACAAAVFVLFRFSPFPFALNLSCALGAGMLYFFPVMARSYSILPLLMFLLAAVYPKTKESNAEFKYMLIYVLLVACIANTHIIMYGFAFCMACVFLYDQFHSKNKGLKLLLCLGLVPPLFTVAMGLSRNNAYSHSISGINAALLTLKHIAVNFYNFVSPDLASGEVPPDVKFWLMALALSVLVFFFPYYLKRMSLKLFSAAVLSVLFQISVYLIGYSHILPNRIMLIPLILFFFCWIALNENNPDVVCNNRLKISIALLFLISMPGGFYVINKDYRENFSSGKEMAEYIKQNIPDEPDTYIFSTVPANSLSVSYYLGSQPLYDYRKKPVLCYYPTPNFSLQTQFKDGDKVYLLLFKEEESLLSHFNVLYKTKPSILQYETYYLVRII